MGICLSSASSEGEVSDENIVYVVEEDGLYSDGVEGMRRLASLYSQQGKKGPNQDTAILCQGYGMEEGVFCGVFDGHGRNGHMVSRIVRDYLPSMLLSQWNAGKDGYTDDDGDMSSDDDDGDGDCQVKSPQLFDDWKEACINAFKAMDKELRLHANIDCSYSGSTTVSIIKQGKDVIIANLGDSRAVLGTISEDGRLKAVQLTTDLKPNIPQEAERIRKNHGRIFSLRDEPGIQRVWLPNDNYPGLAMARAFGDFQLKNYGIIATPQVSFHHLTNKDRFLILATDGIWDVLSNNEVVKIVGSTQSKEEASKAVVEAAIQAWRQKFPSSKVDDCTAICLFLQDSSRQDLK